MKKLFITISLLILSGCSNVQNEPPIQLPNQVAHIQSDTGLDGFRKFMVKEVIFVHLDKNSDGNLSLTELNNDQNLLSKYDKDNNGGISLEESLSGNEFMGVTSKQIRDTYGQSAFEKLDTDNNKLISMKEFKNPGFFYNTRPDMASSLLTSFYASDRNQDDALNFSEFEDCLYAYLRYYLQHINSPVGGA